MRDPGLERNPTLFVMFRVFFQARFYYPVLAVLFVNLGLTIEQYTLLNVAWAGSIVALELPLGALGDQIGRKPLVVTAAAIMVVEMAVLGFFPTDNQALLFWVLLANRVLSGAAEAAASGADEALGYDSLKDLGEEERWPDVLSRLATVQSMAMAFAMLVGAAVYDPGLVGRVAGWLGLDIEVTQATTVRFPVYLTFGMSIGALVTTLRMKEPSALPPEEHVTLGSSVRQVLRAGGWIARTPYVLGLIAFAIVLDVIVRVFLTLSSAYFDILEIAPALFGPLTAAFSALGLLVPPIAKPLAKRAPPLIGFAIVSALLVGGLLGTALVLTWPGILFLAPLGLGFHLLTFLTSHHLNRATASHQRATVLSFKSLAGNLGYGIAGWLFALLLGAIRDAPDAPATESGVLAQALIGMPIALAGALVVLFAVAARYPRMRTPEPAPPEPARSGAGQGPAKSEAVA